MTPQPEHATPSSAPAGPDGVCQLDLPVDGMHCAGCVSRVEGVLVATEGVDEASVNLTSGDARVRFDPAAVGAAALLEAVERAGYSVATEDVQARLEGMHCASCVARVETALRAVPGVVAAEVNLPESSARIRVVAGGVPADALRDAVANAGYGLVVEDVPAAAAEVAIAREA